MEENKTLELRMYFFVPYNISPIQQAIQAGHSSLEYACEFGDTKLFKEFMNHKTWIILNGGTTRTGGDPEGTMQQIVGAINEFNRSVKDKNQKVNIATFHEPDLNNALTAICFICDERVFNYKDSIDWSKYAEDYYSESDGVTDLELEDLQKQWEETLGGPKNVFLRELLKGKKLA